MELLEGSTESSSASTACTADTDVTERSHGIRNEDEDDEQRTIRPDAPDEGSTAHKEHIDAEPTSGINGNSIAVGNPETAEKAASKGVVLGQTVEGVS